MNFLITAIRNAQNANKTNTCVKRTKNIVTFLEVLKNHNYISGYKMMQKNKVQVCLHINKFKPCLLNITYFKKNLSFSYQDLWHFDKDLGLLILSTSSGILTHKDALKKNLGGFALAYVF